MDKLPDEVLYDILLRLDIPELHALSLTSHRLRRLATDPFLHETRLHVYCPTRINTFLPLRPALNDLICRHIIISPHLRARQYDITRQVHHQLIKSRLSKRLATRPSAQDLVGRHVLPAISVAPALVSKSQSLERNMYRRSLELKISQRPKPEEVRFLGVEYEEEKLNVKGLVRRFSCMDNETDRGNGRRRMGMSKENPTRAAVWRLRKFWEKMSLGTDRISI